MNKQTTLFLALITLCLISVSYRATYSSFTSGAQNNNNSFTAADVFPTSTLSATLTPTLTSTPTATPTASPSSLIVINEFSSDGNNQGEWIELYNPTGSSVDLSGWLIGDGALNDPLPAGSSIGANGYAVIIPDNSNVSGIPVTATTIELVANQIGNGLTDNGDKIVLKTASSVVVDQLSYGTDDTILPSSPNEPGADESLARSPNGNDTNTAADWVIDSTPTIGTTNL